MKINFISNICPEEASGGISGMNAAAYDALSEMADVRYVGPVNPPINPWSKIASKLRRVIGTRGQFYFFNQARLEGIAQQVAWECEPDADLDFYMGFTPWILCSSPRPYVAWNDCSFFDYLKIYHNPKDYSAGQRDWLGRTEASWMANATKIFFSSQWAKERSARDYQLPTEQLESVGIFGAMEVPEQDCWEGSKDFYFISTNFEQKNGLLCRRAMDEVWKTHPDARLRIIGAEPPESCLVPGKVIYEGFFKKTNAAELIKFRSHLAQAFALVHPTDSDITPLTVIEAGFFGCPAISVDDFALREVTSQSNHHLLLPRPLTVSALAEAMLALLDQPEDYLQSREDARSFATSNLSQTAFRKRLQEAVKRAATNS
ncbi:glycosyltransferase [bacterium]|nr:glycosyltransferase [bacterium]